MNLTDEMKSNSPDIEAYQAMKLLEDGDNSGAIQKCIDTIERFGDNRNCFLVKARAHIEQEEYGFAEDALQNVLRLDPEHPAAWAMMGEVYYRLGKETKVEYCRNRLESIFPALAESFVVDEEDEGEDINPEMEMEPASEESDEEIPINEPDLEVEQIKTNSDESEESIVPLENLDKEETKQNPPKDGLRSELFETATFADICISQGKYAKALKIYEGLLHNDPDNETYKQKVNYIKQKWDGDDTE